MGKQWHDVFSQDGVDTEFSNNLLPGIRKRLQPAQKLSESFGGISFSSLLDGNSRVNLDPFDVDDRVAFAV